jgi:hypothetical protein
LPPLGNASASGLTDLQARRRRALVQTSRSPMAMWVTCHMVSILPCSTSRF